MGELAAEAPPPPGVPGVPAPPPRSREAERARLATVEARKRPGDVRLAGAVRSHSIRWRRSTDDLEAAAAGGAGGTPGDGTDMGGGMEERRVVRKIIALCSMVEQKCTPRQC